jgi:hypothetical protein
MLIFAQKSYGWLALSFDFFKIESKYTTIEKNWVQLID